jgi:hypothetical protein
MILEPVRSPVRQRGGADGGAFIFKLEMADGTPADPPLLHTAAPTWEAGDTIPLGRDRDLRVIEVRFAGEDAVLVVEPA